MTDPRPARDAAPSVPPNRRDFLTGAATLAGAGLASCIGTPAAKPQGAAARTATRHTTPRTPVEEGQPVRIAVIGTGGMGTGHCKSLVGMAKAGAINAQVVAVCDVCAPRAESARSWLAKEQGIEVDAYRYHEEVLAREDIHGVLIASPEHWHAQMVTDTIMAGKDVYVEKPMTLSVEDAVWLIDVMDANDDMICQVGTQYMMLPKYGEARRIIAEGGIGKPTYSQTSYCRNSKGGEWLYKMDPAWVPGEALDWERWCGPAGVAEWDPAVYARWRRYKDWSTGIIGDLLVHQTTPMLYALGEPWPTRITATGGHYVDKEMENHDQVNINMELEDDQVMSIVGSTCNEQGLETLIRGHEANLFLGGRDVVLRPERVFADDIDPETFACAAMDPQNELRRDWVESIRTREANRSPVELAAKVMVMVDLATRSMWDGKAWAFDPETRTAHAL